MKRLLSKKAARKLVAGETAEEDIEWAYRQLLSALGYLDVELRSVERGNMTAQQLAQSIEYYIPKRIKSVLGRLQRAIPKLREVEKEDYSTWIR